MAPPPTPPAGGGASGAVASSIATPVKIGRVNNNQSPDEKKDEIALKPRPTFRKSMTPVSLF